MSYFAVRMTPHAAWYDDPSETNVAYRLELALERDNRLNVEEHRVHSDTEAELKYGKGFMLRAHP